MRLIADPGAAPARPGRGRPRYSRLPWPGSVLLGRTSPPGSSPSGWSDLPRATILSIPFGRGRCSSFATAQGAVIQASRLSASVRITGIALGWTGTTSAFGSVVRKA